VVEIEFAKAFHRHVECPTASVDASTIGVALGAYFELFPSVRSYVVDESGAVRKHVAIFLNDDLIVDRVALADAVSDGDRLHVFQALSGGCT
jgi:sulfur carrier protein ThiS